MENATSATVHSNILVRWSMKRLSVIFRHFDFCNGPFSLQFPFVGFSSHLFKHRCSPSWNIQTGEWNKSSL